MARPLVSDELWELIESLIPKVKRRYRYPGRKRIDGRKVLSGILFVLQTGIPWEYLPKGDGLRLGDDLLARLREWQQAGVWQRLHELRSFTRPTGSTGRGQRSTARTCERLGGEKTGFRDRSTAPGAAPSTT
jgi:transposase